MTFREKNARSAKHSGAVQSSSPVHAKKSPPKQQKAAASSPAARHARAKEFVDSSHDRRSSLPPLAVHSALPAHPVASIAVPVSTVTSGAHAATDQQFSGSQEAITGLKPGQTDGSGASTSMNAQFVDTKGILGKGTLPDMHGVGQPAAKRAKVGNTILPAGAAQPPVPCVALFGATGSVCLSYVTCCFRCSRHFQKAKAISPDHESGNRKKNDGHGFAYHVSSVNGFHASLSHCIHFRNKKCSAASQEQNLCLFLVQFNCHQRCVGFRVTSAARESPYTGPSSCSITGSRVIEPG